MKTPIHSALIACLCLSGFASAEWGPVGGGLNGGAMTLAVYKGELYAGGMGQLGNDFDPPSRGIARWNGTKWSPLGGGVKGTVISGLAVFKDELYVGGYLQKADGDNGIDIQNVAKWNGTAWSAAGHPGGDGLRMMCEYKGALYTGTDRGLRMLADTGWVNLTGTSRDPITALAVYKDELYIGGLSNPGTQTFNGLCKWNGSAFSDVAMGVFDTLKIGTLVVNTGAVNAMMEYKGDLYVGGSFKVAGDKPALNMAKWNGSAWTAMAVVPNAAITSFAVFKDELAVSGTFWKVGADSANRAASWNGAAWKILGLGLGTGGTALAVYNDELYSAGNGTFNGQKFIAKWSGSAGIFARARPTLGSRDYRFYWNGSGTPVFGPAVEPGARRYDASGHARKIFLP